MRCGFFTARMRVARRGALECLSSGGGAAWLARLLGVQDFGPISFRLILHHFQASKSTFRTSKFQRMSIQGAIAETGVNYVSVGRITQSAPAVDIGLDYSLAQDRR